MNPIVTKGISLAIDLVGKSQIAKESAAKIENGLNKIDDMHQIEPISINDLAIRLSDSIDRQIINIANTESLTSLGGELRVIYINDSIELHLKNYFNDKNNKIILKESKKSIDKSYLDEDSIKKIRESELVYPISPPIGR